MCVCVCGGGGGECTCGGQYTAITIFLQKD